MAATQLEESVLKRIASETAVQHVRLHETGLPRRLETQWERSQSTANIVEESDPAAVSPMSSAEPPEHTLPTTTTTASRTTVTTAPVTGAARNYWDLPSAVIYEQLRRTQAAFNFRLSLETIPQYDEFLCSSSSESFIPSESQCSLRTSAVALSSQVNTCCFTLAAPFYAQALSCADLTTRPRVCETPLPLSPQPHPTTTRTLSGPPLALPVASSVSCAEIGDGDLPGGGGDGGSYDPSGAVSQLELTAPQTPLSARLSPAASQPFRASTSVLTAPARLMPVRPPRELHEPLGPVAPEQSSWRRFAQRRRSARAELTPSADGGTSTHMDSLPSMPQPRSSLHLVEIAAPLAGGAEAAIGQTDPRVLAPVNSVSTTRSSLMPVARGVSASVSLPSVMVNEPQQRAAISAAVSVPYSTDAEPMTDSSHTSLDSQGARDGPRCISALSETASSESMVLVAGALLAEELLLSGASTPPAPHLSLLALDQTAADANDENASVAAAYAPNEQVVEDSFD